MARVKSKRIETSICSIINIKLSTPIFGLPMRLPIIQLNISFQKQIDSYSYINDCFGDVNFVATKANLKKEDENVYFEYSTLDFNISV